MMAKLPMRFFTIYCLSYAKSSDFIEHVEDSILAFNDNIAQRETIEELERVYAYGDKARFR